MAVALKSSVANQRLSSRRSSPLPDRLGATSRELRSRRSRQVREAPVPTAVDEQVVKALPQTLPPPLWLNLLLHTQRASSIITFLLVAAALSIYGWTVYVQQHWGQEYRQFESLKKQERQLIANNEVLKNQIAEQAESPSSGLMVPDPSNAIFLTPAPKRAPVESDNPLSIHAIPSKPLGY